ncbi:MAG: hypothetical protein P8K81_04235, partial [Flavobacteriales bacterium]|nr:hypothetical protein [Flavobacteriales bacterium]
MKQAYMFRLCLSLVLAGLFSLTIASSLNAQTNVDTTVIDRTRAGQRAFMSLNILRLDAKLDTLMLRTDSLRQGGGVILAESIDVDGVSNLDNTDIDGTLDVSGDVDMHGTLDVTGVINTATGSTFGTLTLADGSITDSNGAISFGDENLST